MQMSLRINRLECFLDDTGCSKTFTADGFIGHKSSTQWAAFVLTAILMKDRRSP